MKRLAILAAVCIVGLATTVPGLAEQDKSSNSEKNEKKAIGRLAAKYAAAFNKGDAKAVAALWTPQGDYVGPRGELFKGPEAIEKAFARFFAQNPRVRLKTNITSIRFVGTDVAILDGIPEVTPPLQGPPMEVRATVVLVKRAGGWKIESVRDTLIHKPSNYDHLKRLEWMIGDWEEAATATEGVSVHATCEWTKNKNFIIRRFSAEVKGRLSAAGTQVIGWDPRANRIRSWVFDSKGDFAEGLWQRDGNRWIIDTAGVLQDGSEVSSTNVVTYIDDDTFTLGSGNRVRDGRAEPDIGPVEIKRMPRQTGGRDKPGASKKSARQTILPE